LEKTIARYELGKVQLPSSIVTLERKLLHHTSPFLVKENTTFLSMALKKNCWHLFKPAHIVFTLDTAVVV
jgi:hypothetical protein